MTVDQQTFALPPVSTPHTYDHLPDLYVKMRQYTPQPEAAMRVYDGLNDEERQHLFHSTYRAVAAYLLTANVTYLTDFAETIESMVDRETKDPGLRERIRNAPRTIAAAGGTVPASEIARILLDDEGTDV